MPPELEEPADTSIADLFHQLVEDGGNVVRAEVNVYKQIALHRAAKARNGLIALVAAFVLLLGALITLLVMLAQGLAVHIGPVAGGLVVFGATAAGAYFLIRYGTARMSALGGDEEERAALRAGETARERGA